MNRTFFIKSRKKDGAATLYTRVHRTTPKIDLSISTRIKVDVREWKKFNEDLEEQKRLLKSRQWQDIYRNMQEIDRVIDTLIGRGVFDKVMIDDAVANVVYREELERHKAKEEAERAAREEEEQRKKSDVLLFLRGFVDDMRQGKVKNKGNDYSKNTVRVWKTFQSIMERFYKFHPFTWSDVDKKLADQFICFLQDAGYMANHINTQVICFRAIVGLSFDEGVHENARALKAFSSKKVEEDDKAKEIYLTVDELQALYEMELSGLEDRVRDVFLVGCYTCQRFSDYSRLERENFTTTAKGTRIVRIVQEKTGNSVVIPILNDNLLQIAEKYGYDIPIVSNQVLNREIKEILKRLSVAVPSLAKTERTVLTLRERAKEERGQTTYQRDGKGHVVKPRYELVGSHTARRSGITNLYLTGIFDTVQMMSISGHKDEKVFADYIKLSSDEIADAIAKRMEERRKNIASNEGLF